MATNENTPFGFRYAGNLDGGSPAVREYTHAAADACGIGKGCHVDYTGAVDTVAQGVAAGPAIGVSLGYGAISTLAKIPVLMASPSTIFEVQEDGNTGTASEGLICNTVTAIAPSTVTQLSKVQLSSTTAGTTATQAWRLFAVSPRVGNDGTSTNAKWLVLCNALRMGGAATPLVGV